MLFVRVVAVRPTKESLSKEFRATYDEKALSPFLGHLRGSIGLLDDKFELGKRVEVIVKYSPNKDTIFDVQEVFLSNPYKELLKTGEAKAAKKIEDAKFVKVSGLREWIHAFCEGCGWLPNQKILGQGAQNHQCRKVIVKYSLNEKLGAIFDVQKVIESPNRYEDMLKTGEAKAAKKIEDAKRRAEAKKNQGSKVAPVKRGVQKKANLTCFPVSIFQCILTQSTFQKFPELPPLMALAPTFPLFRLPSLAYVNVIEFLHLKEKFDLAAVSKKVLMTIQRDKQIKKHRMILFICFTNRSGRVCVRVDQSCVENNYWEYVYGNVRDAVDEPMIAQITHLAKVSQNFLVSIKISQTDPGMLSTFVSLVQRLNLILDLIEVWDELGEPRDDVCRYVFEECGHTYNLVYGGYTTHDFTLDADSMGPYPMESFRISHARWLSVYHVKKWLNNCECIRLDYCWDSAVEVNSFLKNWIAKSKIQKFWLRFCRLDFALTDVLHGIPSVSQNYIHHKEANVVITDGRIIKQTNGVEALVCMVYFQFSLMFSLTTKFEIVDEFFVMNQ
ncbi:hypothetical protein CAEBREN_19029 [Caenorhabditis brenneri]|uniref:F-box domain-containing protein n=1 Tax=Caenorhabditis brenneri TaxID=135651 RepID=G0P8G1_CAEBE|nr:hypothetical protein CAEBREN_19029 [Caenorhabditis brenneri]